MGITLGITAAVLWGVADLLARFSTREIGAYRSLGLMQFIGVIPLTVWLVKTGELARVYDAAPRSVWVWAALATLLSTSASLAFYRSLEVGVLAVVAPITSSYPVLTLLMSIYAGERVSAHNLAGMGSVLLGVVLAATSFAPTPNEAVAAASGAHPHAHGHLTRGVGLAALASVGYGLTFWILGYRLVPIIGSSAAVWFMRVGSVVLLVLLAGPTKQTLKMPHGNVWWMLVGIGLFDTGGFLASNFGLVTGHVALVTVLGSLFSAVTVFLAWIILRERLEKTQWLGIALIFAGIVMVSV